MSGHVNLPQLVRLLACLGVSTCWFRRWLVCAANLLWRSFLVLADPFKLQVHDHFGQGKVFQIDGCFSFSSNMASGKKCIHWKSSSLACANAFVFSLQVLAFGLWFWGSAWFDYWCSILGRPHQRKGSERQTPCRSGLECAPLRFMPTASVKNNSIWKSWRALLLFKVFHYKCHCVSVFFVGVEYK